MLQYADFELQSSPPNTPSPCPAMLCLLLQVLALGIINKNAAKTVSQKYLTCSDWLEGRALPPSF